MFYRDSVRPMSARARAVRRAEGERLRRSAAVLRDGEPLSPACRAALADLLDHLGGPAAEVALTTIFDAAVRAGQCIWEPHRSKATDIPPPTVGGGEPSSGANRSTR